MKIVNIKISQLRPAEYNPRKDLKPGDSEYEKLKKSLTEFGLVEPLVVNKDMTVIGGHQRLKVLGDTGHKDIPCVIVDLDKEHEKALNIALNKISGGLDNEKLADLLKEINLSDLEVEMTGFDMKEMGNIFDEIRDNEPQDAEPQIDRAEELNQKWQVKTGDLWLIGDHRLLCGDSTKAEDVARVMGGEKADMVFTDPPYGVSYADKNKYLNAISRGNRIQKEIWGDHKTVASLAEEIIYPAFCRIKGILADRSSYYITAPQGGDLLMMMMMMMQKAGLVLRHMIIWVKNNHVLGRTDYNYKHEPILFGWTKIHDFYGLGDHKFSTWEIPKPLKSDLHPTMKPVPLVINAILNSCPGGGIMADLFGGSGTSMVASENTKRRCRMIEISPDYCAVILQRMADAFPGINIRRDEGAPQ